MHGEEERSSVLEIRRHIGFGWVQEGISDQDEIGL